MGHGGLYYRKSLKPPQKSSKTHEFDQTANASPSSSQHDWEEGVNALELAPANAEQIVAEINEKLARIILWPFVASLTIAIALLAYDQSGLIAMASALAIGCALTYLAMSHDEVRRSVVILYDLELDARDAFEKFSQEFEKTAACKKAWNIRNTNSTSDWKRNAGAGNLVDRQSASLGFGSPSIIKTNIEPPCIKGGAQDIYFYPDLVLLVQGSKAGAISYTSLKLEWGATIFVETESVPTDSQIIGHTWRYVNKNGNPDRRFNNNYQIPEVRYPTMTLKSSSGLEKVLHLSSVSNTRELSKALDAQTETARRNIHRSEPEAVERIAT
jgi:hypothetical protein